jgi:hypothetical protein
MQKFRDKGGESIDSLGAKPEVEKEQWRVMRYGVRSPRSEVRGSELQIARAVTSEKQRRNLRAKDVQGEIPREARDDSAAGGDDSQTRRDRLHEQ